MRGRKIALGVYILCIEGRKVWHSLVQYFEEAEGRFHQMTFISDSFVARRRYQLAMSSYSPWSEAHPTPHAAKGKRSLNQRRSIFAHCAFLVGTPWSLTSCLHLKVVVETLLSSNCFQICGNNLWKLFDDWLFKYHMLNKDKPGPNPPHLHGTSEVLTHAEKIWLA